MHLSSGIVVLLFGLLALGSPQFASAQTEPVNIPDAQLRAVIEGLLSKTPGAVITRAEMQLIPFILGAGRNISDLTGLEWAVNAQQAFLNNNRIKNISPLASMRNLQRLAIGGNQISDLTPLTNLFLLQELHLDDNRISNFTPLANLFFLTQLSLQDNSVSDLTPLTNLTSLTRLRLQGNSITDISALVSNTGLDSGDQVDLRGNPLNEASIQQHIPALQLRGVTVTAPSILSISNIPDANLLAAMQAKEIATGYDISKLKVFEAPSAGITNLAGLESAATTLTLLNLDGNAISDLTPLASFFQLTELKLNNNRISDLAPLASLVRLTELELNNNSISDLAPLASLNQLAALSGMGLTELKLNGNSISDISPVTDMISLIGLDLGNNYISDLSHLAGFTRLARLNLSENRISDLTPLSGSTRLTELDLGNNYVSDLKPLAALRGLIALQLNNNRISDISPVTDMASLIDLDLSDNHLSDLAPLADLTSLVRLWLNGNSISDIAPLLRNQGLNEGDQIDLHSNFLNDESNRIHLGALRDRGISVVNDTAISVAEMASALEGEDIEFQVSLSAPVEFDIEIVWDISTLDAKEIEDFAIEDATGALSINALDTEGIIAVRTTEDEQSEQDETFDLFINFPLYQNPPVWVALNSTLGTGTIIDDDRPVASAALPHQKLTAGDDALELDLSSLFSAPGELAYQAVSSDASLAKVKIAGGLLILRPEEAGVITITITATDGAGFKATQTFMVTIDPTTPRSRLRGWRLGFLTGEREAQHQESDP